MSFFLQCNERQPRSHRRDHPRKHRVAVEEQAKETTDRPQFRHPEQPPYDYPVGLHEVKRSGQDHGDSLIVSPSAARTTDE